MLIKLMKLPTMHSVLSFCRELVTFVRLHNAQPTGSTFYRPFNITQSNYGQVRISN